MWDLDTIKKINKAKPEPRKSKPVQNVGAEVAHERCAAVLERFKGLKLDSKLNRTLLLKQLVAALVKE